MMCVTNLPAGANLHSESRMYTCRYTYKSRVSLKNTYYREWMWWYLIPIAWLMQERRYSSALAVGLRFSCINPKAQITIYI